MRGNPAPDNDIVRRVRSIPAYAGEPVHPGPQHPAAQVYPRVCGGTAAPVGSHAPSGGLSPRMRGNRQCYLFYVSRVRSIPAYAGEPAWSSAV